MVGKGFTEWTNVKKARPLFKGHIQPIHPLNNNYYNLMDKGTVEWQTQLMKKYGLTGMIYYHYYFCGKKLLEKPAENLLKWKDIEQPFFFCWANHSWRKTWNGTSELLVEQTYGNEKEWEEHLDDGSKDRSGQICDEYASVDARVKVIHKENGGLSDARNKGMDRAAGNYFMFIDSDDYIAPTMVEVLHKNILDENADIVACNYRYFFENDRNKDFSTKNQSEILSGTEIFYHRKNERNYGIWTVAWNKLYKRETFGKVRFRVGRYHEDEFWANDIYQMDIKVVTIPECLYYYRQRGDSIMGKKSITRDYDIIEAFHERICIYLREETYADQAYKVLIYSLEYLEECKRLVTNRAEKIKYSQAEIRTKNIVKQLNKGKLSIIKKISLVFIEINPCLMFVVGMKFRNILESFL